MNVYMKEVEKRFNEDSRKLSIWFTEEVCLQTPESKRDILLNIKDVHEVGI